METRRRQVGRGAVAAAVIVLGVGAVTVIGGTGPPEYSSSVTFFATRPAQSDSADSVARAMDSYAALVDGEALAARVISELDLDLTVEGLGDEIEETIEPDSVLLTATVTDSSAERALSITKAIAADLTEPGSGAGSDLVVVEAPDLDPDSR